MERWGGGRGLGGVVVGVWVEWCGCRRWGGVMVGDVVSVGRGGVASVESHMLVVRGFGEAKVIRPWVWLLGV